MHGKSRTSSGQFCIQFHSISFKVFSTVVLALINTQKVIKLNPFIALSLHPLSSATPYRPLNIPITTFSFNQELPY